MAVVNIITNLGNQVGLQKDFELLKEIITGFGHEVRGVMCYEPSNIRPADINIFCELIRPDLFGYAHENWLIPNPEWFFGHWNQHLPCFRRILLKTAHAKAVLAVLSPESIGNMQVVGFESRDLFRQDIPRKKKFLHLAGKSSAKNTQSVMLAWLMARPEAELVVVSEHQEPIDSCNVTFHKRVTEGELIQLMNECQFHLMPSAYEGWGHAIHEGMGCGAVMITTASPPMASWGPRELLIECWQERMQNQVLMSKCDPREVLKSVNLALALTDEQIVMHGTSARNRFLKDNSNFRHSMREIFSNYE